jgi:Zn-finger nucleic acid-binding protein
VLSSAINAGRSSVDFNICKQCRRFWLERDGWLLSKRETMNILREWPAADTVAR